MNTNIKAESSTIRYRGANEKIVCRFNNGFLPILHNG